MIELQVGGWSCKTMVVSGIRGESEGEGKEKGEWFCGFDRVNTREWTGLWDWAKDGIRVGLFWFWF